jgi:hypothetical protein
MNKTRRVALFLCYAFAASWMGIGCSSSQNVDSSGQTIVIDTSIGTDSADLSPWLASLEVIALDDTSAAFFEHADKLILHGDNYIVLDRQGAKKALVFDQKGNYVTSFGTIGKGPGELLQFNNLWIKPNGYLEAYDFLGNKLVQYLSDYRVASQQKLATSDRFTAIHPLTDSTYVGTAGYSLTDSSKNHQGYRLAILNNFLEPIAYAAPFAEELKGLVGRSSNQPFVASENYISFQQSLYPTIYHIYPDGTVVSGFNFSFVQNGLPADFETSLIAPNSADFNPMSLNLQASRALFAPYQYFAGEFWEMKDYLLTLHHVDEKTRRWSLIDKASMKTLVQSSKLQETKDHHFALPSFTTVDAANNTLYAVYNSMYLEMILTANSPHRDLLKKHPDGQFLIKMKLK